MLDFANVYPSVMNVVVVGMMATIFLSVMKFLTSKWTVPGLTPLFASI